MPTPFTAIIYLVSSTSRFSLLWIFVLPFSVLALAMILDRPLPPRPAASTGPYWLRLGTQAFNSGDMQRAVPLLSLAAAAQDLQPEGWIMLGDAYQAIGDPARALRAWQNAGASTDALERRLNIHLLSQDVPGRHHRLAGIDRPPAGAGRTGFTSSACCWLPPSLNRPSQPGARCGTFLQSIKNLRRRSSGASRPLCQSLNPHTPSSKQAAAWRTWTNGSWRRKPSGAPPSCAPITPKPGPSWERRYSISIFPKEKNSHPPGWLN